MKKIVLSIIVLFVWLQMVFPSPDNSLRSGHIQAAELVVQVGSTIQMEAIDVQNPIWSSGNSEIATVNSTGLVTGISSGSAYIRCFSETIPIDSVEIFVYDENTLLISSVSDLCDFRNAVNAGDGFGVYKGVVNDNGFESNTFLVSQNLDLSSVCGSSIGNWIPIGTTAAPFKGGFVGAGFTVSNLYIHASQRNQGLFGYIEGASIKKIHIISGEIIGTSCVGALIGNAISSEVLYCTNAANVFATDTCGGIAGYVNNGSAIKYCLNLGDVTGTGTETYCYGGICGLLSNGGSTILYCVNSGNIVGFEKIGGITGCLNRSTGTPPIIRYCLNYGNVQILDTVFSEYLSDPAYVGGIYGHINNLAKAYDCFSDEQMCVQPALGNGINLGTNVQDALTNEITGTALSTYTGFDADNWTFSEDMYPCPKGIEDVVTSVVASTPIFLENNEAYFQTINQVYADFKAVTDYGVVWSSDNENLITFDEDSAHFACVMNTESIQITATKDGVEKNILITVPEPQLLIEEEFVVVGDSTYINELVTCEGTWHCSNDSVVSISQIGSSLLKVIALTVGQVDITFESDVISGSITIYTGIDKIVYANITQLMAIRDAVNNGTSYEGISAANGFKDVFIVYANTESSIDLSILEPIWEPIGNTAHPFRGFFVNLDKCYNLKIEGTQDSVGFFGVLDGATLMDVRMGAGNLMQGMIKMVSVSGNIAVGSIAGYARNTKFIRCSNSFFVQGASKVGGLVGIAENCVFEECLNIATVTVTDDFGGGIVGESSSDFNNCMNGGLVKNLTEDAYIGGICGQTNGSIRNCINVGQVGKPNVSHAYQGGICGYSLGGIIENCFYDQQISPNAIVSNPSNATIINSSGKITSEMLSDLLRPYLETPNIWSFNPQCYPIFANLEDVSFGNVVGSALILSSPDQTIDNVLGFSVSILEHSLGNTSNPFWTAENEGIVIPSSGTGEVVINCIPFEDREVIVQVNRQLHDQLVCKEILIQVDKTIPIGTISGDTTIYAGHTTEISIDFVGEPPFVYQITGDATQYSTDNYHVVHDVLPLVSTNYIITSLHNNTCEASDSEKRGIAQVRVVEGATSLVVDPFFYCQYDSAVPLSVVESVGPVYWSATQEGPYSLDAPTPSTEEIGSFSYYAYQIEEIGGLEYYSDTAVITVFVNPLPSDVISGKKGVVLGGSTTLYAEEGFIYEWYQTDSPEILLGTADSLIVSPQVPTSYSVFIQSIHFTTTHVTYSDIEIGDIITTDNVIVKPDRWQAASDFGLIASGIVYEKDSASQTFYVVSIEEGSGIPWGFNGINISGLSNTTNSNLAESDMAGRQKTDLIIAYNNSLDEPLTALQCAAVWARSLGEDWYLPATGEVLHAYQNKDIINASIALLSQDYPLFLETNSMNRQWSSTTYSNILSWYVFHNGTLRYGNKDASQTVYKTRAVRSFDISSVQKLKDSIVCNAVAEATVEICTDDFVSLSDTTCSGIEYTNFGYDVEIPALFYGDSVVFLNLYNQFGCDSIITLSLNVRRNADLSVSGNTLLCSGDVTFLTASGGDQYEWYLADDPSTILSNTAQLMAYVEDSAHYVVSAMYGNFPVASITDAAVGDYVTSDNVLVKAADYVLALEEGKTIVGVVFEVDEVNNSIKIVSSTEVSNIPWAFYGQHIPGLSLISTVTEATNDMDGKAHTDAIINFNNTMPTPLLPSQSAAVWVRTNLGNAWNLPSSGELNLIFNNIDIINNSFSALQQSQMWPSGYNYWYWTSSTYSYTHSWCVRMTGLANNAGRTVAGPNCKIRSTRNYDIATLNLFNGAPIYCENILDVFLYADKVEMPEQINLCVGASIQFPYTSRNSIVWTSSDTTVLQISESGIFVGISEGQAIGAYLTGTGCTDSVLITVVPSPQILAPYGTNVCIGESIELNATGAENSTWYSENNSVAIVSNDGTVSAVAAGSVYIYLASQNLCSDSILITVHPALTGTISGASSVCLHNLTQTYMFQPDGNFGVLEYSWTVEGGIIETSSSNFIVVTWDAAAFEHNIMLQVTDGIGCANALSLSVVLSPPVEISVVSPDDVSVVNDTIEICISDTLTLTVDPSGTSYQWQYPSGSSLTKTIIFDNIAISDAGWYKVTVVQETCTEKDSVYLVVKPNQGAPTAHYAIYYGSFLIEEGTSQEQVDTLNYASDLYIVFSNFGEGENITGCGFEARNKLPIMGGAWTEWTAFNPEMETIVDREFITTGLHTFQLRHSLECASQFCGEVPIVNFQFFVVDTNVFLRGTADINEMSICQAQDSVTIRNIYSNSFNSQNQRVEGSVLYYDSTGGSVIYETEWVPLTYFGQQFHDSIDVNRTVYPILCDSIPKISVWETPNGIPLVAGNVIVSSGRIATVESISDTDTTWSYSSLNNTTWTILPNPSFTGFFDQFTCTNDQVTFDLSPNITFYSTVINWQYAHYPSSDYTTLPSSNISQSVDLFTYYNGGAQNNNVLHVFDFVNNPDTISIAADMTSAWSSCPIFYDSARIYVNPNHHISLVSDNNEQTVCAGTPIDDITYQVDGGSDGVNIEWLDAIPNGLVLTIDENMATLSGIPENYGTFAYRVVTVDVHNCPSDTAEGVITALPNASLFWDEFSGSEDQDVCPGIDIIPIVYHFFNAGDFRYVVNGLPEGIDYALTEGMITISGSTLQSGAFEYEIVTIGVREPCSNDTARGSITVPYIEGLPLSFDVLACGSGCTSYDGSIEVSATGGKKPYVYSISDVQGVMYSITTNDSLFTFSNLLSNRPYWISVQDSNMCEIAPQNPITLVKAPSTNLTFTIVDYGSGCEEGGGIIKLQAVGGYPPYVYRLLINGVTSVYSEPTYENVYSFTDLSIGMFYFVSVTDSNMCEKNISTPIMLNPLPMFALQVDITNYGSGCTVGDGFISASVIRGVAPYIYMVSDGVNVYSAVSSDSVYVFDNLNGGMTYTVSVQDDNLCLYEVETPITLPPLSDNSLSLQIQKVGSRCVDGDGYITLYAHGGSAPYIYKLNDGLRYQSEPTYDTVYTFSNLFLEHSYFAGVIDAAFCELYLPDSIILPNPPEIPLQLSLGSYGSGCADGEGIIQVFATGGIAPYVYKLSHDGSIIESEPTYDTVYQFTNLLTGTYNVSVSDSIDCEVTPESGSITLSLMPNPLMITDILQGTGCSNFGFIQVGAMGGVMPYTYLLYSNDTVITSEPTYDTTFIFQNLNINQSYIVNVLDDNLCSKSSDEIVFESFDTLRTFVNNYGSGCLAGEGFINMSITGGVSPYIFRAYIGNEVVFESNPIYDTSFTFENLNAGNHYNVSVMGAYLCEIFVEGGITLLPLSATPLSLTIDNYGGGCEQGSGSIRLTATGGTAPFIYRLYQGTTIVDSAFSTDSSFIFNSLQSGSTYYASIVDANGCEIVTKQVTIPLQSENPLSTSIQAFGSGCFEGNGSIAVSAADGLPPYIYRIFDGVNTVVSEPTTYHEYTFENLNTGIPYFVSVIDDNLCENIPIGGNGIVLPAISDNPLSFDSIVTTDGCGSTLATIEIYVSGGSGNYQFILDNELPTEILSDSLFVFYNVSSGNHTITVTDQYLCSITQGVETVNNDKPVIEATPNHSICRGNATELSVLAGQSTDFSYEWSKEGVVISTETSVIVYPGETTTYLLHVFDITTLCDTTCEVVITVSDAPSINVILPENTEIENDTLYICESYPLSLSIEPTRSEYEWIYPTGTSMEQIITIGNFGESNVGWYTVLVNQNNCYARDSVYVAISGVQGAPYATVSFYRGDIFEHTQLTPNGVDSIVYSSNLNVTISDPVQALNVENCGFEYRLYYTANEGWTEWTDWIVYTEPINITAENLSRIGFTTIQIRHDINCASQFCGDVLLYEYSFFVISADTMLQATPMVNESEICRGQENVYMTNIYDKLWNNSEIARYEYQFSYLTPENLEYYQSGWNPLSQIGQIFEDTIYFEDGTYALMIPSTPPIPVSQTPDGQTVHDGDMIHAIVRVAMIYSIDSITLDTTWTSTDSIHYSWTLLNDPSFTPLLDHEVCYGSAYHIVDYGVDYFERPDFLSVSWYYSNIVSDTFSLIPISVSLNQTEAFTYWNAEAYPYNRVISMYNFTHSPDTISVIAELKTAYSSCPIVRDTGTIFVLERHQIELESNNSIQRVCQNSPIENIVWELSGGSDGAYIEWQGNNNPQGLDLSFEGSNAILSGVPQIAGTFDFIIYTSGTFAHNQDCGRKYLNGRIVVDPVNELTYVYDATCQSLEPYTSSLYPRFAGIDVTDAGTYNIDSVFANKYGCDSSVTLVLTVNEGYVRDTMLETTCQSSDPFTSIVNPIFNNLNVSQAGVYVYDSVFETVLGCDSIEILKLTVYPMWERDTVYDYTCKSSQPYISESYPEFGVLDASHEGVFYLDTTFNTSDGCDSMVTLQLTVNEVFTPDTMYEATCQSDLPFTSTVNPIFNNLDVSAIGIFNYDSMFHTTDYCDSAIILQLTVNPTYPTVYLNEYTCQSNEPYTSEIAPRFTGIDISQVGSYTIDSVFKTENGCDSSVTLLLHVNPTYNFVYFDSICQGQVYRDHGFVIPASVAGTSRYIRDGNTISGCDSTVTLWLSVFPAYSAPIMKYICEGESYIDDNFEIINPEAGIYNDTTIFATDAGCDSVLRLILIVQPLPEIEASLPVSNDTVYVCALDSLSLTVMPNGANSYHWSYNGPEDGGSFINNQAQNQTISTNATGMGVKNEGWYIVTVDQTGCIGQDSIYVKPMNHQSAPNAVFKVYRGEEYLKTITNNLEDTILFSSDLNVVVSNPVFGNNLLSDCSLEYRYYNVYDDQWTPWMLWADTSIPIQIPNSAIQIGSALFDLRHSDECTLQSCGISKTRHIGFVVFPTPEMLQGVQDIDQPFICMAQDSVRLTNIRKWYFDNHTSIYQYQSEYRRDGQTYCQSNWMPLTELHQVLDTIYFGDTMYALSVPSTPFIPVQTTTSGDSTLPDDHIRISLRIATAAIEGSDTTWNYEPSSRYIWAIVPNPHFNNTISDKYICNEECTNENGIKLLMEIDESCYPKWVNWYYASYPSQDYQLLLSSYEVVSNELFSYRRALNENHLYNNDLTLFDFTEESDTIQYIAELISNLRSCPSGYEDFTVFVFPDHKIEIEQGELDAELCLNKPMDSIIFSFGGGATSAIFSWIGTAPTGLYYQNQDGYGFIGGTPTLLGTFYYQMISSSDNSLNTCKLDTIYGNITTHRNYLYPSTLTICQGQSHQWHGKVLTQSGIYYDSLENVYGCDSIYQLTFTVNPSYDSTIAVEICEGENYTDNGFNFIQPAAGEFFDSLYLVTTKNCDSIVRLDLTVHPRYDVLLTAEICEGENYIGNGFEIINPAVGDTMQTQSFITDSHCDSIVTLLLHVNPLYETELVETLCLGESYDFFGQMITQPGIYMHHLHSVSGCDSIIILNINFIQAYNVEVDTSICEGGYYLFGGYELMYEGVYSMTMQSQNGCDSTVTLNLVISNAYIAPIIADICEGESYSENGFEIMNPEIGTYHDSITYDGQLCDSIVALTLNVYPLLETNIEDAFCEGDVFEFMGMQITEPGIYEASLSTVSNGHCDSTIILALNMNAKDIVNIASLIPQGGSYNFFGEILTEPGIYEHLLTNMNGCDSLIVLNLSFCEEYQILMEATICQGEEYEFGPFTLTQSGVYTDSLVASIGCDSIITLTLSVNPTYIFEDNLSFCSEDPYYWHGRSLTESGIYWDSLHTQFGCDSIYKLTLNLEPEYFFSESRTVCSNQPYEWRGQMLTESGIYWDSLLTLFGCDSVYQLIFNMHQNYIFDETIELCSGDTCEWRGRIFTVSGVYYDAYSTTEGCDSIYQLTLTMHSKYEITESVNICDAESYEWNDTVYTESGFYTDSTTSVAGCDSIYHLNLSFNSNFFTTEDVTVCHDFYIWHDQYLTESGIYWDSVQTIAGCDSVYQLNLNLQSSYSFYDSLTICEGDSVNFNGIYVHEAGVYADTISTVAGCDSIINLTLMLNPLPEIVQIVGSDATCTGVIESYSVVANNASSYLWTVPEEFSILQGQGTEMILIQVPDTTLVADISVQGINECGSSEMFSYTITVNPIYEINIEDSTCRGVPYEFNGQMFTMGGFYSAVLQSANGCDSIVHLLLSILPTSSGSISASICENETYNFNGTILNEEGVYYDTLQMPNGCDSVVMLDLSVYSLPETVALDGETEFCSSTGAIKVYKATISNTFDYHWSVPEGFEIVSQQINVIAVKTPTTEMSGTISVYGENVCGISDTLMLEVNVLPSYQVTFEDEICEGETYNGYGFTIYASAAGLLSRENLLTATNGCDSLVSLLLTVHPKFDHTIETQLCEGSSIEFNGETITQAGSYKAFLETMYGCDSVVTLKVAMAKTYQITTTQTICYGESYDFGGDILTESGTYTKTFISTISHCDSVVTLNLIVSPQLNTVISDKMCEGGTYEFYGEILNTPGVYTNILESEIGCDSIITLTLSYANPEIPKNITASNIDGSYILLTWEGVADAYEIYRDGNYLTTVGSKAYSDSTLNQNVLYCYNVKSLVAECEGEMSPDICIVLKDPELLFNVFPNPTSDVITVVGEDMEKIVILSVTQTQAEIIPDNPNMTRVDVSRLQSGTYFMRIFNSKGEAVVKRFIILK